MWTKIGIVNKSNAKRKVKEMRRLFIIRKDLNLSKGKMSAMIAHQAEAYWTNAIRNARKKHEYFEDGHRYVVTLKIDGDVMDNYVNGLFIKTLCEAKNLGQLKKVRKYAEELHLKEGVDFGFINDACLIELTPENEDGTCTVGVWFAPLPDEVSHAISKHYQLYKDRENGCVNE